MLTSRSTLRIARSAPPSRPRLAAAVLVDRCLRVLARREARSRRALGEMIDSLRRRRGHVELGFPRFGDWARERLGISGGEADALAKVACGLRRLPLVAAAFDRGEIGFAKARVLVAVATEETEALWLGLARRRTVRELEEEALLGGSRVGDPALPPAGLALEVERARAAEGDEIDGEAALRVRLSCPARVWLAFRRAVALARRVAGEELPVWGAAEAIVAEGLASAPNGPGVGSSGEGRVAAPQAAARARHPLGPRCTGRASPDSGDVGDVGVDGEEALRWLGLEREEIDTILRPTAEIALIRGPAALSPAELDFHLREIERAQHAVDATIGRLLLLLLDRRLDRDLGFDSFEVYVREQLGFSLRKARALVALARGVARDGALGRAYGEGKISWVQALTLLPLVRRGAPARAWIARAGEVTLRQLCDDAGEAIDRAVASGAPVGPPPRGEVPCEAGTESERVQMCEPPPGRDVIEFRAPASVAGLWSAALEAWRKEGEANWQALERMLEAVVAEWSAAERHRDPVFERDGWRCAVPGCSARRDLHDHHIVFRSRGGTNERDNRITVCRPHHAHGIHEGRMRATGRAPDGILWELGLRSGCGPIARLAGDRYLEGAPWGGAT